MARTAQISKEKQQSIITLRYEGQSTRNISRTLKVQSQDPSRSMMKLALMRTATEMEDPELPLLQRISSLELPASEITAQIKASQSSSDRYININCSEGTVWIRPSWSNCCKETTSKEHQFEETCFGQETWAMDIRQVEICPLVWSPNWRFLFQPPCLCETQSARTDDLCMCISHRKTWRRCYGVGVLCWWHCLWFI